MTLRKQCVSSKGSNFDVSIGYDEGRMSSLVEMLSMATRWAFTQRCNHATGSTSSFWRGFVTPGTLSATCYRFVDNKKQSDTISLVPLLRRGRDWWKFSFSHSSCKWRSWYKQKKSVHPIFRFRYSFSGSVNLRDAKTARDLRNVTAAQGDEALRLLCQRFRENVRNLLQKQFTCWETGMTQFLPIQKIVFGCKRNFKDFFHPVKPETVRNFVRLLN